jgi:hypothetical protein
MRIILFALFIVMVFNACAQENTFVKYFDSAWQSCAKENASFYTQFQKQDDFYKCTSYYLPSDKLYARSTFADTLFKKGIGLMLRYTETGKLQDSSYFFNDTLKNFSYKYSYYKSGALEDSIFEKRDNTYSLFHYYENGKLFVYAFYDKTQNKIISKGYDTSGKEIPDFIYFKPARFGRDSMDWINYLTHNIKAIIPVRQGARPGLYEVIVKFKVDSLGNVINVFAKNDPGFGTKEEAIKIIKKSPRWNPAIKYNKTTSYDLVQPIAFQVSNQ